MIFRIDHMGGDRGDGEEADKTEYLEAGSPARAWERMGKPEVVEYRTSRDKDRVVEPFTNVVVTDAEGFRHRGRNPGFDWEKDKARVRAFACVKRGVELRVEPVKVGK